ncbi:TMV resistance protein N [Spatholobus suberectus]|nr:TMV resistance protein N [Spatholobus suberectus]
MECAHFATEGAVVQYMPTDAKIRPGFYGHRAALMLISGGKIIYPFVKVCFPGSRVPRQFIYQTTLSSIIDIDLPSSPYYFVGLILCVVLSPTRGMKNLGAKIWCQCYLADGKRLGPATTWYHEAVTGLNSDHVFMWCDSSHFWSISEIYDTDERRVSFEFFVTNDTGERVTMGTTECGVCLFDTENLRRARELKAGVRDLRLKSPHGATSMAVVTSDDINNHEPDLCEDCSCSRDCLFGMELTNLLFFLLLMR